jgi:hypothetical protein
MTSLEKTVAFCKELRSAADRLSETAVAERNLGDWMYAESNILYSMDP